jgi:Ca2+-transporting ATPase
MTATNSVAQPTWHVLSCEAVEDSLRTDIKRGLTQTEAARRLAQYGPNTLTQARERSAFSILFAQFRSLIVALLVAATAIAFAMGENIEGFAVLVVIVLNATIGFFTEWKAEQALSALQKQSVVVAHVVRDSSESEIPAEDLVPGDLVFLAAGARVPVDGRIIESAGLQIEEAALTGESLAVTKTSELLQDENAALGDRLNMAFLGTTITAGRGRLVVTATGVQSEVGKIGLLIDDAITQATPLEKKLARLGRLLIVVVLVLCAVIVLAGWIRGATDFWHMLEIGLSLAIAAVPEGLPAVTTMTLALGMQRMARMRALVRRLPAVETLGSVTVICTDKTGTLTKNEMTVCVYALDHRRVRVTGAGYTPVGHFQDGDTFVEARSDKHLALALRIGMLCNDAKVECTDHEIVLGDPTEAALIVAAEKAGMNHAVFIADFPRINEVPFNSASKRMVTVHRTPQGQVLAFLKGSPGTLLAASSSQICAIGVTTLTPNDRRRWEETNKELAGAALRVLGLAYRELPDGYTEADLTRALIFVGLVGMSDPLRDKAKEAIATCREAGIRTVIITGDQQPTATEIARQLGIDVDSQGKLLRTVHDRELVGLDAEGWKRVVADAAIFARVSPEHKLQIVEALQQQGHVVAMTGDGVNDAPALKKADIGIAMGIKGTEVAKENAGMVITDDSFASIVDAVEQGRIIYSNILRFLHYLLSCNFSEILTVFIALMIGWPLPLVALQILWLNLITDIFPAFALALEPSSPDVMKRLPRDPQEPLLTRSFIGLIAWQGLLLAVVTLLAFGIGLHWHGTEEGLRRTTTMAFMTLALTQVFHAFDARSQSRSVFTSRLFTNVWLWGAVAICLSLQGAAVYMPLLQKVLHTVPPTSSEWVVITGCSLLPVAVVELVKVINRVVTRNKGISHV